MGWEFARLGEVASIRKGTTDPQSTPESTFELFSIPACDAGHPDVVLGSTIKSAKTLVKPDDVLVSKLNPHIPRVWQVTPFRGFTQVSSTEFLPLVPDRARLDHGYLRQVLVTPDFVNSLVGSIEAATKSRSRVKPQQVLDVTIPLPPIEEQRRIAHLLDEADRLQGLRKEANEKAQTILPALFVEMFGDPQTNPMGWDINSLGEVATIQIGPFGSLLHQEDYVDGGIPLVNPKHIQDGRICPSNTEAITPEKHAQLSNYHLRVGDVVMGRRGEMGRCAVVSGEHDGYLCGTGSLIVRPREGMAVAPYLASLLSHDATRAALQRASLGLTLPNLNATIVQSLAVMVPPVDAQRRFSDVLAATKEMLQRQSDATLGLSGASVALRSRLFADA